jgi:D-threonate/D-erythronate kinase
MDRGHQNNDIATCRMLVVADDFTGACDTGIQFGKNKLKTIMISDRSIAAEGIENYNVIVINTDSRQDDGETAYRKVYTACKTSEYGLFSHFYKKLDSTMRGNIGAELSAMMDALSIDIAFLAPALPQYGRTTVNGKVYLNNILLEETGMANDPRNPVKDSDISQIIARQSDKKTGLIMREDIVAGREVFFEKINRQIKEEARIIIFDALTDDDLRTIASVTSGMNRKVLYAGCSGLAMHLAGCLPFAAGKKSSVVIAGSVNAVTRAQTEYAARQLNSKVADVDTLAILSPGRENEKFRLLEITRDAVNQGNDIIIRTAPSKESVQTTMAAGASAGISSEEVTESIAVFLGEIAATILTEMDINGILLTGGDTAMKTSKCIGTAGVILENEVMHGIPYGRFADERIKNRIVVSKAGGFGQEDAIVRVLNFLRNG